MDVGQWKGVQWPCLTGGRGLVYSWTGGYHLFSTKLIDMKGRHELKNLFRRKLIVVGLRRPLILNSRIDLVGVDFLNNNINYRYF